MEIYNFEYNGTGGLLVENTTTNAPPTHDKCSSIMEFNLLHFDYDYDDSIDQERVIIDLGIVRVCELNHLPLYNIVCCCAV